MADKKATIKGQYDRDDSKRSEILDRARRCAALTKPWLLPPTEMSSRDAMPENFQSVGSRGVTNLEGRMLMALFPPSIPWFALEPAADIRYDPDTDPDMLQEMEQHLFLRELLIQSVVESANLQPVNRRRRTGFRSNRRMEISQILVTGDSLSQLTDDYRLKTFRRDRYVTRRDSAGDVLYHITKESVDPLGLDEEVQRATGLNLSDLKRKDPAQRMQELYTRCAWQPWAKTWLIEQEINSQTVNESEERITPFLATAYELAAEEDYGRGFIELNLGDLSSVNNLEERILDFAAIAAKQVPVIDQSSTVRDQDLTKRSGEPIRARVQGGQVQDIGWLGVDKLTDFSIVHQTLERKTKDLGMAMLLEADVQPRGERVTATQVQRIAMELEGALGGVYAPIAEEQQVPLLQRIIHQLERDNLLPSLPADTVEIKALTGMAALRREVDRGNLLSLAEVVRGLGDEAVRKINVDVLVDIYARYSGIYEPGLIKTQEELKAEAMEAIKAELTQKAGETAIGAAGNVAQGAAEQAMQQPE